MWEVASGISPLHIAGLIRERGCEEVRAVWFSWLVSSPVSRPPFRLYWNGRVLLCKAVIVIMIPCLGCIGRTIKAYATVILFLLLSCVVLQQRYYNCMQDWEKTFGRTYGFLIKHPCVMVAGKKNVVTQVHPTRQGSKVNKSFISSEKHPIAIRSEYCWHLCQYTH